MLHGCWFSAEGPEECKLCRAGWERGLPEEGNPQDLEGQEADVRSRAFRAEGVARVKPQGRGGEKEEKEGTDPPECLLCARLYTQGSQLITSRTHPVAWQDQHSTPLAVSLLMKLRLRKDRQLSQSHTAPPCPIQATSQAGGPNSEAARSLSPSPLTRGRGEGRKHPIRVCLLRAA